MTVRLLLFLVYMARASGLAATNTGSAGWQQVYEARGGSQWVAAVWLRGDGSWIIGGKDLLVEGGPQGSRATDVRGFAVYGFGEDESGRVLAVGTNQAVWEERANGFALVHVRPGPPLKGRAAHEDILQGIGYLDPERPHRLIAYGSLKYVVLEDDHGPWRKVDDAVLARIAIEGPSSAVPSGCHRTSWFWLSGRAGVLGCREHIAYLYTSSEPAPLGPLPKACGSTIVRATRDGANLYVACGDNAHVWQRSVENGSWSMIPGVAGVIEMHARNGCLLVATNRQVLRRCK